MICFASYVEEKADDNFSESFHEWMKVSFIITYTTLFHLKSASATRLGQKSGSKDAFSSLDGSLFMMIAK